MNQTVTLHIDELVLEGFGPMDRDALADALRHELARLIVGRGAPSSLGAAAAVPRLDAGTFIATPNAGPTTLGTDIARAIYGGMNR